MDPLTKTPKSRAKPEFQAVILSGLGSQLGPLVSPHGDDPTPVALLPVNNKPLLSYTLSWLEEANIKEALIVCPPRHASPLRDHIQATSPSIDVEIKAVEPDADGVTSTVSILRKISGRLHTDFIVLSSDFVPSPGLELRSLLKLWRVDMTGITAACLFYEASEEAQKRKDEPLPVVTYAEESIIHVSYDDDKQVRLPMHLLSKYGNCRMIRKLADSHVYIFKRTVLDLLPLMPKLKSIKQDLLPFLCSLQYSRSKKREFSDVLVYPQSITTPENIQDKGTIGIMTAFQYSSTQALEFKKTVHVRRPHTPTTPTKVSWEGKEELSEGGSDKDSEEEDPVLVPSLRCGIIIRKLSTDGPCARANTLAAYRELNMTLLKEGSFNPVSARDGVDPRSQISKDSAWDGTSLGFASSVDHSSIGKHCVIGKHCKIKNSVIMEHVQLDDGVIVENCILSRHTKIGEKTKLVNCESTPGAEIKPNSNFSGVKLDGTEEAASEEDKDE